MTSPVNACSRRFLVGTLMLVSMVFALFLANAAVTFAQQNEAPTTAPAPARDDTGQELKQIRTPDILFVPTPQAVVDQMLELADVKKTDLLYDLGCGDGRIVVTAATKYGCHCVGYDIDPQRIMESMENVKANNVQDLVRIEQKDIFTLDLSNANVITLYLLSSLNAKLIPQLEKCKPGTRIVSHDFDMQGIVKPDKSVEVTDANGGTHTVNYWVTPLKRNPDSIR